MKIAVINYTENVIDVVVVDVAYLRDNYDGDVQDYLEIEHNYNSNNMDYMCNLKSINIIDQDEINQQIP